MANARIEEEASDKLSQYAQIPISFEVRSRLEIVLVDDGLGGIRFAEEPVDPPYIKDYDDEEDPQRWQKWNRQFPDFGRTSPGGLRKACAYAVNTRESIQERFRQLTQQSNTY